MSPVVLELGYLIERLPNGKARFNEPELLAKAKEFDIPELTRYEGMRGEVPIALLGRMASIGWMKADGAFKLLNPLPIKHPKRLTVLEGSVMMNYYDEFLKDELIKLEAPAENSQAAVMQSIDFTGGELALFRNAEGPDNQGKCWYLITPVSGRA